MTKIIERNTTIQHGGAKSFPRLKTINQPRYNVLQGEREMAQDNRTLVTLSWRE